MTRVPSLVLVALAGWFAHAAWAQTNPLVRGSATTPRVAQQNRIAPVVTQFLANELSPFPAECGDRDGTVYINAEVEPHIAVNPLNPDNLVATWQQDRYSNGGARGLVGAASFDGGRTWTRSTVPVSACTGGEYARATDPWVSFSPDGTAHQIILGITGGTFAAGGANAMLVSRSRDGGLTWSAPITLVRDGGNLFNDKETITADPTDSRLVYAVWDRLMQGAGGVTIFTRTTDGGVTWDPVRAIYDPGPARQTIGNVIRVLPDGTLLNLFSRLGAGADEPSINVMRSTDRGASWSAPIRVSSLGALGARDPATNAPIRDGAIVPQMAVAPGGAVYVVWQDARFTQARDSIAISRSTDGGFTWSTPVRVNGDPGAWAFTPQVHVRGDGVIGVTYYDLRSDTSDPTTLLADFWIARSSDGLHWTETRISPAFDIDIAPNAGGYFLGDYTGLDAAGTTFVSLYAKTTGNPANRNDLYLARITPGTGATRALKRAEEMPAEDPGAGFWQAVRENAMRSLEKRRSRFAAQAPPAAVR